MAGRPRSDSYHVPAGRLLKLLGIVLFISRSPKSKAEVMARFDLHQRTFYRYIGILEESGVNLQCDDRKRYLIKGEFQDLIDRM